MSDTIPQAVRDDYNTLLEQLLPFAEEMLGKHGEFYPFGMALDEDGEVVAYESDGHGEMPPSEELIDSLVSIFLAKRPKENTGHGICFDRRIVQAGLQTDTIMVMLEHADKHACQAFVPY